MDYYVNCFAKIERETTWFLVSDRLETSDFSESNIHPAFTCSKSTMEMVEQGVKSVQR